MKNLTNRKRVIVSALLWIASMILTLLCFLYQDKTGPTYPLEGDFETAEGVLNFKFLRSETIGANLNIMLIDPVPVGVGGYVKFRRYKSDDGWSRLPLQPGEFAFSRRGRAETVKGVGVGLPSLRERAGKYEYYVYITDSNGGEVSVTGEKPVYARYKADVPTGVLIVHIVFIFASMTIGIRTMFEAIVDGKYKWMLQASVVSLVLGGFIFGPLVQWHAFGVWWSGVPFGYDWTDNKVLVELVLWLSALFLNRGVRRNRWSVYAAGIATLIVYFIPHSIFGSEFNYTTGTGHGTAG